MSDTTYDPEVFEFDDLTPQTVPFRVGDDWFLLLEPSEDVAVRWRNSQIKAARMAGGKIVGIGDVADSEPTLISLCLYRAVLADGTKPPRDIPIDQVKTLLHLPKTKSGDPDPGRRVPISIIRSWPSKVAKAMHRKAMEIGELEEESSKERTALLAALDREDSPITLNAFRDWVDNLVAEDHRAFAPLSALVKEETTDGKPSTAVRSAAGNGQSATEPTSASQPN